MTGKFHYNLKKKTEVKALLWLLLRSFFLGMCNSPVLFFRLMCMHRKSFFKQIQEVYP